MRRGLQNVFGKEIGFRNKGSAIWTDVWKEIVGGYSWRKIQTRNYDNNEGRKVYVTEVVASNVQFLESRNASNQGGGNGFSQMPEPPMMSEPTPYVFGDNMSSSNSQPTMNIEDDKDPFAAFGESVEISDNDLPF